MKDCIAFATYDDFEKKRLLNLESYKLLTWTSLYFVNVVFLVIIIVYSAVSTMAQPISNGTITRLSIEISSRTIWKILKFKLTS
jgi:hypothetical protein